MRRFTDPHGATWTVEHRALVRPCDSGALAEAIGELVACPSRRLTYAEAGRDRAAAFRWERIFDDLMADYARVIGGRAAVGAYVE